MRIALVGAGPTAACVMESLLHAREQSAGTEPLDVVVFDPTPHPWCGRTYGEDVDAVLTNINTARMSTRHWDADHITRWFVANGYGALTGSSYCPRRVMGRYYQDSAWAAAVRMDTFELVPEPVVEVTPRGEELVVTTPANAGRAFDHVVLCTGETKPPDPYGLAGSDGFTLDPYPLARVLPGVDPDDRVAILGAGLTAVDVALALRDHGHRGPIAFLSRRGLLPIPRPPFVDYELRQFTLERFERIVADSGELRLRDLVRLMGEELEGAGLSLADLEREVFPERTGFARLRDQLSRLHRRDFAYTLAGKASVPLCEDAWALLPTAEKRLLTERFRHVAYSLCCPIPEYRARELLTLADSGQLSAVAGLRAVAPEVGGGFRADADGVAPMRFDRVISAITSSDRVATLAEPLVDALTAAGTARRHPLGGLDVERATSRLLDGDGRPQRRLYALGGIVGGALYFFNGHIYVRRRTVDVATAIVAAQAGSPATSPVCTAHSAA